MTSLSRRRLLQTGVAGGLALAASPAAVLASPAPRAPIDDDLAYLQLASVTKIVTVAVYDAWLKNRRLRAGATGTLVRALRAEAIAAHRALDALLRSDAPASYDYLPVLPKKALRTLKGIAGLAATVESISRGALLGGAAVIQDPATRRLLARVAASDSEHVALLRSIAGLKRTGKLPGTLTLDAAGARLDPYLSIDAPGYSPKRSVVR